LELLFHCAKFAFNVTGFKVAVALLLSTKPKHTPTREASELTVGSHQHFSSHTDIHLSFKNINPHDTKLFAEKLTTNF